MGAALRHLLRERLASGKSTLPNPDAPEADSGLFVLGMGKLGGCELNYSSDIDLIVLYDAVQARVHAREGMQSFFVRLTRNLVRILEERTGDGYVFRTDLRLRPDPASTPLAMSVAAALTYYESVGQNWERAALIKARPVAGDRVAGSTVSARAAALSSGEKTSTLPRSKTSIRSSARSMLIKGGGRIAVAGHDIKTGRGGIREIEFFAQTQQLIWGGRIYELQVGPTCEALRRLAAAGRTDPAMAAALIDDYRFLRRLEHRLQMVDDAQTHTLPASRAGIERIAIFLGYQETDAFVTDLLCATSPRSRGIMRSCSSKPRHWPAQEIWSLRAQKTIAKPCERCEQLGFSEPAAVAAIWSAAGITAGCLRRAASERARS